MKEWKSYANLHAFDTANPAIVEGLMWTAIATAALKRFECDQNLWTTAELRCQFQSLGFCDLWHWGGCAIHTLMLLLSMKLPIGIPVPIDPHRPEVEDGLRACFGPTHPGLLHAIFHKVPTRPFHHPCSNRPTARQIRVVVHRRSVALVVAHRPQHGPPLPVP